MHDVHRKLTGHGFVKGNLILIEQFNRLGYCYNNIFHQIMSTTNSETSGSLKGSGTTQKMNRRKFLGMSSMAAAGLMLNSCGTILDEYCI